MRIILADHHPAVLKALQTRLLEDTGFLIVGTATDASSLIELAKKQYPELVLLDWNLPGRRSESLIDRLHKLEPCPHVIVMSSVVERGRTALAAGADTFISKGEDTRWLIETLNEIKTQYEGKRVEKSATQKKNEENNR